MARKVYTAEQHRTAFETWYETRNYSAAAKSVDANYLTPRRWATEDYDCQYNCPYHSWNRLMDERDAALQVRHTLIQQGNLDPVQHDIAMRQAVSDPGPKGQNPPVMRIIRSDLERLHHWELLYSKVYYDLTGLALDYGSIKEDYARKQYQMGLHVTNAESGIRMLKTIQEQIDLLQGSDRRSQRVSSASPAREQLTLQQLRKMRQLAQNTPPQKLQTMMSVVVAEDAKPASAAS